MSISRSLFLLLLGLSGCAAPEGGPRLAWPWPAAGGADSAGGHLAASAGGQSRSGGFTKFDFDWQLEGDPEIMPVQVFDDGERMWLQFPPEGAWPAVFEVTAAGWRPVSYRREGPYMVVGALYEHLEVRGGHLRGAIRRVGHHGATVAGTLPLQAEPADSASVAVGSASPAVASASSAVAPASPPVAPASPPGGEMVSTASIDAPASVAAAADIPSGAAALTELSFAVELDSAASGFRRFDVGPADITMRQAIERWASIAGWTFSSEHWAVDVDIPLVGEAGFQTDFKSAVRELLAATEMGDRPLQPCFYSNRVVRVVPYAQPCDRRKGMGVMS